MKDYTTIQQVCDYLGIDLPSESSPIANLFEMWIPAMSRYIDNVTKRVIYDTESQTFTYDGDGTQLLHISDCVDITSVTVDSIPVTVFEYPQNKPWTSRIVLNDSFFTKGNQNVAVTAIQAMSKTLPADINSVATVLVAGAYNAKVLQGKSGTTERIGNYSVQYRDGAEKMDFDNIQNILSPYKRLVL